MFLSCLLGCKGTRAPTPSSGLDVVDSAVMKMPLVATLNYLWRKQVLEFHVDFLCRGEDQRHGPYRSFYCGPLALVSSDSADLSQEGSHGME